MKQFNEYRQLIIDKCKSKSACEPEFIKLVAAANEDEFLKVLVDNLSWCIEHKIINGITAEEYFGKELMIKYGIYNSGAENIGFANTGYSNTGYSNTGDRNTGDWNTGDRNTGDRNTGDRNTGYSNTGYRNTGDWNTGDWNIGDWNTGYSNTGYRNTGDRNTGDSNTGDWNTGDWNTGYSNTGDRNTGAFCTGEKTMKFFNKDSDWTEEMFLRSNVYRLLQNVDTKFWVPQDLMSDEEKQNNRGWKLNEGFYRDIPFKEAFANQWNNWSEESRSEFKALPNFDAEIFESITGVKVK